MSIVWRQSMLATMMRNLWNKQPIRQQTLSELDLLQQKVHCVAFVIDGSVIDGLPREVKEAFDQIKKTANGYGKNSFENYVFIWCVIYNVDLMKINVCVCECQIFVKE